ncbi:MAG: hypothetical protein KF798_04795 [Candidatus Paracaedibacteraceae bacterium]|nr:hypothetical protein [Candidatus Paracaedibacteraceae bacterium]
MNIKKQILPLMMLCCIGNAALAAENHDGSTDQNLGTQTSQNFSVRSTEKTDENGVSTVVFEDVVECGGLYTLNVKIGDVCTDIMLAQQKVKFDVEWCHAEFLKLQAAYQQKRLELFPDWTDDDLIKFLYVVAETRGYSSNRLERYKSLYARVNLEEYHSNSDYRALIDAFAVLDHKHIKAKSMLESAEEKLEQATSDLDLFHDMPRDIQVFLTAMSRNPNPLQIHINKTPQNHCFSKCYASFDATDRTALNALADKYQNSYPDCYTSHPYFDDDDDNAFEVSLGNLLSTYISQFDRAKLDAIFEEEDAYDHAISAFERNLQEKKRDLLNTFFLILKTFSDDQAKK